MMDLVFIFHHFEKDSRNLPLARPIFKGNVFTFNILVEVGFSCIEVIAAINRNCLQRVFVSPALASLKKVLLTV
jgi:hypothetical protein